jgi:hypothetical protein
MRLMVEKILFPVPYRPRAGVRAALLSARGTDDRRRRS